MRSLSSEQKGGRVGAILSAVVGIVLIVGGGSKLLDERSRLERVVREYELVPEALATPIARLIGPVELVVGVGLVFSLGWPAPPIAAAFSVPLFRCGPGHQPLSTPRVL